MACVGGSGAARGAIHAAGVGRGAKFPGSSAFSAGSGDTRQADIGTAHAVEVLVPAATGGTSRVACGIGR